MWVKTWPRAALLWAATAAAAAAVFAGCGSDDGESESAGSSAATAAPAADVSGKKVVIVGCADAIPYCAGQNETFKKALGEAGVDVTVLTSPYDATQQAQQIDQAISQKADAIVVQALTVAPIVPQLTKAKAAGIPIVLVDAPPPDDFDSSLYAAHVGGDSVAQGVAAGEALIEGMKAAGHDSGKVLVIGGAFADTTTPARISGFEQALQGSGYEIVDQKDAAWDPVKAASVATQMLAKQGGDVAGIYGMSGDMAASIAKAAAQTGRKVGVEDKGIVVVGSNCSPRSIDAIRDGSLYADEQQSPTVSTGKASEVVIELLKGGSPSQKTVVETPTIKQDNVDEYAEPCTF